MIVRFREPPEDKSWSSLPLLAMMRRTWWALVSVVAERDGRKFDSYGPNAKGLLVFDANGRYSMILIAAGLPHFVSGNRSSGTADENKAVVAGSIAHFRSYVVDEADKSFTLQIDRATFPNWEGKHNTRSLCHHWR